MQPPAAATESNGSDRDPSPAARETTDVERSEASTDHDVDERDAPPGPKAAANGSIDRPDRETEGARGLLVTAVATAVLVATAAVSADALVAAVAAAQALLIFGWVVGSAMPGRIGGLLVATLACAGADAAVVHWPTSAFSPVLAPLGLGVLGLFIHQLTRGVVRARVVESLAGCSLVLVAGIAMTGWIQLRHEFDGGTLAVAALAGAGGGCALGQLADLVWSRPRLDPEVARGVPGLVVATVGGATGGAFLLRDADQITTASAVLLCGGLAAITVLVSAGIAFVSHGLSAAKAVTVGAADVEDFGVAVRPWPALRPLTVGLLPLALVAPAAYVLVISVG